MHIEVVRGVAGSLEATHGHHSRNISFRKAQGCHNISPSDKLAFTKSIILMSDKGLVIRLNYFPLMHPVLGRSLLPPDFDSSDHEVLGITLV